MRRPAARISSGRYGGSTTRIRRSTPRAAQAGPLGAALVEPALVEAGERGDQEVVGVMAGAGAGPAGQVDQLVDRGWNA